MERQGLHQRGRKPLRDALCRPAVVAMRFNPDLKARHAQPREAGTTAKVAIAALMRKLLPTASALAKAGGLRTPKATCE
ncbi:transposase [Mangrovicoccus ximenensis]|uniref:transposase n=1 Tax=Mangrovicoccus ximenensis TaxID=1911570 RepID=UPI0038B25490